MIPTVGPRMTVSDARDILAICAGASAVRVWWECERGGDGDHVDDDDNDGGEDDDGYDMRVTISGGAL